MGEQQLHHRQMALHLSLARLASQLQRFQHFSAIFPTKMQRLLWVPQKFYPGTRVTHGKTMSRYLSMTSMDVYIVLKRTMS